MTRVILVLMYSAGLFFVLLNMSKGIIDFGMVGALLVFGFLLVGSINNLTVNRKNLIVSIIVIVSYAVISGILQVFSFYVIAACDGFAIFVALAGDGTNPVFDHPIKTKMSSTRLLLVGLYSAGLVYALIAFSRWGPVYEVMVAIIIEVALLVGSVVQGPLDKKGIGLFTLSIFAYVLFSFLLGPFEEVVVMTAGGMAIYAGLTSEPKFPVTKRAIGTGLIVGVVMTFLGVYLALKLGIVYFVGAELLGFLLLSLNGKYTPQENTISVAIANTSSMVSVGVLITFPAIAIFGPTQMPWLDISSIITFEFIAFVTGISSVFGLLLLIPFRKGFEKDPWPQIRPQAETINSLGADTESKVTVLTGMALSASYVGAIKVAEVVEGVNLSAMPHAFVPSVPDWIGITNSPLIGAIGFFVGWKRVLTMAIGSIVSVLFWIILEGAAPMDYASHLTRPEILYLAIGIFVTVIAGDIFSTKDEIAEESEPPQDNAQDRTHSRELALTVLKIKKEVFSFSRIIEEIQFIVRDPRGYMTSKRGQVPIWIATVSMVLFIIVGALVFSALQLFVGAEIPLLLFVFGSPIAMISAYFTAKSISETGMLAGYISDMISIPAILLFRITFSAITTFMAMLGALQDAAITLLVHLKLGTMTGVRGRDIMKGVLIGVFLGTFVGSLITFMLYKTYGFGGTEFPAPAAQLFGFLVVSLTGLSRFQLPGLDAFPDVHPLFAFAYLLAFGIAGFLAGRGLSKRGLSPISLAVGILVPPATTIAMLFGGFMDYRLRRQARTVPIDGDPTETPQYKKWTKLLSGVVAGEAIVTVIWVLYNAFLLFTV